MMHKGRYRGIVATLRSDHGDLAVRAFNSAVNRLSGDHWPEYYNGPTGQLIGRRSNFHQFRLATPQRVPHKQIKILNTGCYYHCTVNHGK